MTRHYAVAGVLGVVGAGFSLAAIGLMPTTTQPAAQSPQPAKTIVRTVTSSPAPVADHGRRSTAPTPRLVNAAVPTRQTTAGQPTLAPTPTSTSSSRPVRTTSRPPASSPSATPTASTRCGLVCIATTTTIGVDLRLP